MTDIWANVGKTPSSISESYFDDWDTEDFTKQHASTDDGYQPCPTCESSSSVCMDGSELVCKGCGSILDIPIEWAAEYRWFSADSGTSDPSRCGFPVNHLMPESSLGTMILSKNNGSKMMNRIKRYHMWNLMPYRERTLWSIFDGLQVRASNAGINTAAIEEAKELYAQLTASAICRGQNQRDAMLAACLWEALKRHDSPRMPKDIAEIFTIEIRQVTRGIKQFQHLLAMRSGSQTEHTYANMKKKEKAPPVDPSAVYVVESPDVIAARANVRKAVWQKTVGRTTTYKDFVHPFLTNLSIPNSQALEKKVFMVCERVEELGVVPENTPPSLTASVIVFCSSEVGIKLSHTDVAQVCGISPVTIQKCLKRLLPWKKKLLEE
jgi:transcription initiation factor TFIIB